MMTRRCNGRVTGSRTPCLAAAYRRIMVPPASLPSPQTTTTTRAQPIRSDQEDSELERYDAQEYLPRPRRRDSILQREPIPVVSLRVPDRAAPPVPQAVPVLHSSAYLRTSYTSSINSTSSSDEAPAQEVHAPTAALSSTPAVTRRSPEPTPIAYQDESALQWALRKADASLDELESKPLPLQKAVYSISRGPVGAATSTVVQTAAKFTVEATVQAAKAAAPLGRWALSEGTKAAASLIKQAVVEGVRAETKRATQIIRGKSEEPPSQKRSN